MGMNKSFEEKSFSFRVFYSKRIKRLFPSLLTILVTFYCLGWVLLLKDEFKALGKHIYSGAIFISNFTLWNESGYFDRSAEWKPLLHLWSLAIEEQFYLITPILFYLIFKYRISLKVFLSIFAIVSFALYAWLSLNNPVAAFYNPLARFWQILAGSILALVSFHLSKKISKVGLTIFSVLLAYFSVQTQVPGILSIVAAAASVCFAVFAIVLGRATENFKTIFNNKIFIFVGKISYPLYLWHWPLLVYTRITSSGEPDLITKGILFFLSFALSVLTYYYVEKPVRYSKHWIFSPKALGLCLITIGIVGRTTQMSEGIPGREIVELNKEAIFNNQKNIPNTIKQCGILDKALADRYRACIRDEREEPKVALIGDSKADSLALGLFENSSPDSRVLFIGGASEYTSPIPIIAEDPYYDKFTKMFIPAREAILDFQSIEVVVVVAATRALFQLKSERDINELPKSNLSQTVVGGVTSAIKPFVDAGKKVILVVDNPTLPSPQECYIRRLPYGLDQVIDLGTDTCGISIEKHLKLSKNYRESLEAIANNFDERVKVFDTIPILCDEGTGFCRSQSSTGTLLYAYTDHISDDSADKIGVELMNYIDGLLN